MYVLYFGDIPIIVSGALSTLPICPPFNSHNVQMTCNPFATTKSITDGSVVKPYMCHHKATSMKVSCNVFTGHSCNTFFGAEQISALNYHSSSLLVCFRTGS